MQVKCKYCDSYISDTDERCPSCGATNDLLTRTAIGAPKTIEELKTWYIEHNLPDENITRFFIGKDIKEARAFGIYKEEQSGNYIVYKNKDTGERVVRYEGKDESYAVNELYQKLKTEIQNQKSHNNLGNNHRKKSDKAIIGIFILILIIISCISYKKNIYDHRNDAYYTNNNALYYNYGDEWYFYDVDGWTPYYGDTSNFDYADNNYSSNYGGSDFSNSTYFDDYSWGSSSSSSDWDSDSSWDSSSSWDSGGSDWSSDW